MGDEFYSRVRILHIGAQLDALEAQIYPLLFTLFLAALPGLLIVLRRAKRAGSAVLAFAARQFAANGRGRVAVSDDESEAPADPPQTKLQQKEVKKSKIQQQQQVQNMLVQQADPFDFSGTDKSE